MCPQHNITKAIKKLVAKKNTLKKKHKNWYLKNNPFAKGF